MIKTAHSHWAATSDDNGVVRVSALGLVLDVTGLSDEEAVAFQAAWSRCHAGSSTSTPGTVLQRATGDFQRANEALTSNITLRAIDALAGSVMMFHACGLADPATGQTIAFVAASGTGKTTIARTLGRRLGYISDETIAVRDDLSVMPYPKPLSLNQPAVGLPKTQVGPDALELLPAPAEPRLRSIVILARTEAIDEAVTEQVPLLQSIALLTPQLSALAKMDRGLVQLARILDQCGGATRVRYTEAASIEHVVPKLFEPVSAPGADWHPAEIAVTYGAAPGPGMIRRASVQDAVIVGGELLVLASSALLHLGPVGAAIWAVSADWIHPEAVHDLLLKQFGSHPQSRCVTDDGIATLLERGVLAAS